MSSTELPKSQTTPVADLPIHLPRPRLLGLRAAALRNAPLVMIVGMGLVLRMLSAVRLTPHVDEASSILAAHATAQHGWPVLPSGTVYFQGATLSWLLAPLVWLGAGDLDDLTAMRLIPVIAGTVTLYLCYRLGIAATGDARIGLVMAFLVALDPVSVQWSGHVRMYGLLQLVAVGMAWCFVTLLAGRSWRKALLLAALCWLAVFTHVGASLLLPAMALAAALAWGQAVWRRYDLLAALALGGLAPLALLVLNRELGSANVATGSGSDRSRRMSFVGDNLLQPLAHLRESLAMPSWEAVSHPTTLTWLLPGMLVAVATVAGGRVLLRGDGLERQAAIALLCLYWLPVLAVGVFTVSPKERYLLHAHVIGYLFVAVLVAGWRRMPAAVTSPGLAPRREPGPLQSGWGPAMLVTLLVASSLVLRLNNRVVHPDYHTAMAYVIEHHEDGEPIVLSLPAVGYLAVAPEDRDDLVYLAGSEDMPRAQRYTRVDADGELIDYWVGVEALTTVGELRSFLSESPDAWIVVDEERLDADWAFRGNVAEVLAGETRVVYRGPGGALVLRAA